MKGLRHAIGVTLKALGHGALLYLGFYAFVYLVAPLLRAYNAVAPLSVLEWVLLKLLFDLVDILAHWGDGDSIPMAEYPDGWASETPRVRRWVPGRKGVSRPLVAHACVSSPFRPIHRIPRFGRTPLR